MHNLTAAVEPSAHLVERLAYWTDGAHEYRTAIPDLVFHCQHEPTQPSSCMVEASVGFVVQGALRALVGDDVLVYDNRRVVISAIDMPVMMQIANASPAKPYLGLALKLDLQVLTEVITQSRLSPPRQQPSGFGIAQADTTPQLLDAFVRLVNLLDEPAAIPMVAPLVQREIYYRLLISDQGARLWQIASTGTQSHRIARSIEWLKSNFAQPLRIEELANHVQMSASSFHHHFRQLTAMTPLQFQKWLRLNEARRLMVVERMEVAAAAYRVGYESPSQFSREYARMFGAPPRRDIENLRDLHGVDTGAQLHVVSGS